MDRILVGFFLSIFLFSCSSPARYEFDEFLMDTSFEVIIYSAKPSFEVKGIVEEMYGMLRAMEKEFSTTDTNSFVYRLNRQKTAETGPEIDLVVSNTLSICKWTSGVFDPTIYPVVALWGFYSDKFTVPAPSALKGALKSVGYANIHAEKGKISLVNGASVDFGGILKGYAVDQAVVFLKAKGIENGIVNAGGNLKIFGSKPDKSDWVVGIRHPRIKSGIYLAVSFAPGKDIGVATSGDYERYFMQDGVRYHHIMSPFDGYPVHNGVVSVSIIDPSAMICDALTTSLFVMGKEMGLEFADKNGIAAMFIMETDGALKDYQSKKWIEIMSGSNR